MPEISPCFQLDYSGKYCVLLSSPANDSRCKKSSTLTKPSAWCLSMKLLPGQLFTWKPSAANICKAELEERPSLAAEGLKRFRDLLESQGFLSLGGALQRYQMLMLPGKWGASSTKSRLWEGLVMMDKFSKVSVSSADKPGAQEGRAVIFPDGNSEKLVGPGSRRRCRRTSRRGYSNHKRK